eukprot:2993893-Pleurochrysis_carterae.AAC.8
MIRSYDDGVASARVPALAGVGAGVASCSCLLLSLRRRPRFPRLRPQNMRLRLIRLEQAAYLDPDPSCLCN